MRWKGNLIVFSTQLLKWLLHCIGFHAWVGGVDCPVHTVCFVPQSVCQRVFFFSLIECKICSWLIWLMTCLVKNVPQTTWWKARSFAQLGNACVTPQNRNRRPVYVHSAWAYGKPLCRFFCQDVRDIHGCWGCSKENAAFRILRHSSTITVV